MLRCASSLVIAAYAEVRLIPQNSRALPAAFLRGRPIFTTFKTFFEVVNFDDPVKSRKMALFENSHLIITVCYKTAFDKF
jgi:hypothetical protein